MTESEIKEVGKNYGFDFSKLTSDLISEKITENQANRIWSLYNDFINNISSGFYTASISMYNTLQLSGYFVNYKTFKRGEILDEIIGGDGKEGLSGVSGHAGIDGTKVD